jgi:hypothetical protein
MIDPLTEHVISLTDATKILPARRGGKRPHVSCIYRWTTIGCRGVVLESIQIGGTRCTSREAVARFFARLTPTPNDAPPVRTPTQRQRAIDRDTAELEAAGL